MHQKWQHWNTASRKWLWILVVVGILAALPVIYDRYQTESSSNKVELVFNYRGLADIASYQPHPEQYIQEQLDLLKSAGIQSMAMFESNLRDLKATRRIMIYNAEEVATMTQSVVPTNENFTHILFTNDENAGRLSPVIEDSFTSLGIAVKPWEYKGQKGLIIEIAPEEAALKPMQPDPITFEMLHSKGFNIVPRMSDSLPYDEEATEKLLAYYEANGVKRLLFEGDSVKGFADNEEKMSVKSFANLLNQHGIGVAAIENTKKPQQGFNLLANLIKYNVVRLYSLSDRDALLDEDTIADRFALATKDRNIRMLYINAAPNKNVSKAMITNSIENIINSLNEPGNAIKQMENNGFTLGQAEAFDIHHSSGQKIFKMVVLLGAVAFIALLISYFLPMLTIAVFVLGLIGSAGLYVLKPTLFEQALALMVAISAPTIAMILAVRKINELNAADRNLAPGRRLAHATVLFIKTAIISLAAIPFVVALLNNITYSLVLNQFRGVSLLHAAPIGLVAVYVLLYRGGRPLQQIGQILRAPITLLWVAAAAVIGAIGFYYLSRTGNGGSVTPIEMVIRPFLENTLHVRPRNKEFLMGHPLFLLGIFVSLKYRNWIFIMIFAVIGQLSMVDTFAHIHSPLKISFIRDLLGLGLGLIIGLIAIAVWQIAERCWKKWSPRLKAKA
ncbi:DUF5693 family protein [Paenibacillus pini]|uniref:Uncharacterized protein n=1 Tax=Paenibacillus pini JCM 16418 TaxID=1236976 RepID=W7Z7Y8_9BACL|nr:DUF5693 family protein [Paenibacillus pini]GAF10524.1 hypothetical protein JCM16418_4734 [Paenibacillus pini JCM 16418]